MHATLPLQATDRRRAAARATGAQVDHLLDLQQSAGNRAVATMVQRTACCAGCAGGGTCEAEATTDEAATVGATAGATSVQRLAGDDQPMLREGSSGPDVADLQGQLNQAVDAGLDEDGAFGPLTAQAVRRFQASRGLDVDGIVGPATRGALDEGRAFDEDGEEGADAPSKATDPADDFRILGLPPDHLDHRESIFFDFGSSEIVDDELGKVGDLAAVEHDLVLEGTSSEEGQGNAALTDARITAVTRALDDAQHGFAKQRRNSTQKAVGQIDYRHARVVKVTRSDAADPLADCSAKGSVVDCPSTVEDAFDRAADLLMLAMLKLADPGLLTPSDRKLVRDLFVDDSPAAISELAGHIADLRQYVIDTKATQQKAGESEPAAGPFHRCENSCNSTCGGGALAFNRGVDATSFTTFCNGFTEMTSPAAGTGATVQQSQEHVLIHEAAHGTRVIDCQDFAKGHERAFGLLNREQALHNADSFTALARNLVQPGSAATEVLHEDTGARGKDPGVEEPLAWLDRWLEAADFDTSQLYDVLKEQEGFPWPGDDDGFERAMRFVSEHFEVTKPPRAPSKRDREKVAAINDRYDRVRKVLKTNDNSLQVDTGPAVVWEPGPGRRLEVPETFGELPIRERIEALLAALAHAATDIREGQEDAYAGLAPKLCNRRTPGFAFSG